MTHIQEDALLARITVNPDVFGGKPIIRGRRLAVEHVLGMLAAGDSIDDRLALRGYVDPEGEYGGRTVVCSIEKVTSGYRLLVEYGPIVQADKIHPSATAAHKKADVLREELLKQDGPPNDGRARTLLVLHLR